MKYQSFVPSDCKDIWIRKFNLDFPKNKSEFKIYECGSYWMRLKYRFKFKSYTVLKKPIKGRNYWFLANDNTKHPSKRIR